MLQKVIKYGLEAYIAIQVVVYLAIQFGAIDTTGVTNTFVSGILDLVMQIGPVTLAAGVALGLFVLLRSGGSGAKKMFRR